MTIVGSNIFTRVDISMYIPTRNNNTFTYRADKHITFTNLNDFAYNNNNLQALIKFRKQGG